MTTRTVSHDQADDLVRAAYAATYRLPEGFAGFQAMLRLHTGHEGGVVVRSPGQLDLALDGPQTEVAWARAELASLIGHRWHASYQASDGRWTKSLDPPDGHPLGRLVRFLDDPFDSSYRLLDGEVALIVRRMGQTRFCIVIQERVAADRGRRLPTQFTVAYWRAGDGGLERADTYSDGYAWVDGVLLPARRRVVSAGDHGLVARELVLTEHQLLATA